MSVRAYLLVCAAAAAITACGVSSAPGAWSPVSTNEIVRWKAERGAKGGVVVDRAARTVSFLAETTGVVEADPVEFLLIGPDSDRAYEAFAVAAASPAAIAAGLEAIGVPRGLPVDARLSRFWPQGEAVAVKAKRLSDGAELRLVDMLLDERAADEGAILDRPPVYAGGSREASGAPEAERVMPCAIFSLYGHSQSLLQFDGTFDQSGVYGRFKAKRPGKPGELLEFTLSGGGPRRVETKIVTVGKGADLAAVLGGLRSRSKEVALYASLAFAPDVPLADAARAAKAFAMVDGAGVRMNGAAPGQFFYRAYLPEPDWRRREGRIFQPFEVHVARDGSRKFVFIEEDYSGEGIDPKLKPRETAFSAWAELPALVAGSGAEKVNVLFIFAPPDAPVGELTPAIKALSPRIATFYLFAEDAPLSSAAQSPKEGK